MSAIDGASLTVYLLRPGKAPANAESCSRAPFRLDAVRIALPRGPNICAAEELTVVGANALLNVPTNDSLRATALAPSAGVLLSSVNAGGGAGGGAGGVGVGETGGGSGGVPGSAGVGGAGDGAPPTGALTPEPPPQAVSVEIASPNTRARACLQASPATRSLRDMRDETLPQ